jgi:hypothetical protein
MNLPLYIQGSGNCRDSFWIKLRGAECKQHQSRG